MSRPAPIQIDRDTWIIMREHPANPKAIVHRVTDTRGDARFLLLVWNIDPAKRRMHGIFPSLKDADLEVKWDNTAAVRRAAESVGSFQGYPDLGDTMPRHKLKLAGSTPDHHP